MRFRPVVWSLLMLGFVISAQERALAQQKGQARINPDGVVRLASASPPQSMDPHKLLISAFAVFANLTFDRLTRINEKAEVMPMLATSWSVSKDGSSLEFKLRKDVKFNDGTPFDAAAVRASIERGKTVTGSTVSSALAVITAVEVVDPYTVRMRVAPGRGAEVPALLATHVGMMISPKAIADPSRNLALNPGDAGSGPYITTAFEPRSKISYERAPGKHWEADSGRAKRIEMTFVAAAGARLNAIRAGQFELAQILGSEIVQAKQVVASSGGSLRGVSAYPTNSQSFYLRGDRIPDPRIRKAIQLAIDRNAIANGLFKDICPPTTQPYPKRHWAYAPDAAVPAYDPARARALLKEAGASDFKLEIFTPAGSSSEPVAQVIQAQLVEVGIKASIATAPQADTAASIFRGERDSYAGIVQAHPDPSATVDEIFLTRFKVVPSVPAADFNQVKDLAGKALDPRLSQAQRAEMYRQIWRMNAERAFVIPICFTEHYWVMNPKVGGWEKVLPALEMQGALSDWRYVYLNQ